MAENPTKMVECSNPKCGDRRQHWSTPEIPRNRRQVEVPQDYEGPSYCSIECAAYCGDAEIYANKQPWPK